jgi:hypothetical protein
MPKKSNKGLVSFDKKCYFPVHFLEQLHMPDKDNEVVEKIPKIAQAIEEDRPEEPEMIQEERKSEQGSFQIESFPRRSLGQGLQTTDNKNHNLISMGNQQEQNMDAFDNDFCEDDLGIENENAQTVRMPHFGLDTLQEDFMLSRI